MKISSINSWTSLAKILLFIGIGILIISIPILVIQYFSWHSNFDSKVASELGSYISGFVGVFWTGAGAILVYATFQEQKKLLEKQQFESSFFKLLDTYNGLITSMSLNSAYNVSGKAIFLSFLKEIKSSDWDENMWRSWLDSNECNIPEVIEIKNDYDSLDKEITDLNDLKTFAFGNKKNQKYGDRSDEFYFAQFNYFFKKYKLKLDPYCQFVFTIFKFIDKEDIQNVEICMKLLWSQMTEEELVVLFYYAKNKELQGDPRYLNWLKKYDFLDDLSHGVFLKDDHKEKFCCNN